MEELTIKKKNHHRKTARKEVEPPQEQTLEQVYLAWHAEQYESMVDSLNSAFGENYELIKHEIALGDFLRIGKATTEENKAIVARLLDLSEFEGVIGAMRNRPAYTITIHFPDLVVDNGRRTHAIKDMWVRIELSAAFCRSSRAGDTYFTGNRTTLSYAEISSEYSFSHLSGGWNPQRGFRGFCLGHTPFATLCNDIHNEWNQNKFLMFCFQLHEYMRWESLEGGPYRSILDISERNLNRSGDPELSSSQRQHYYKNLLSRSEQIPVTFVKAPHYYGFMVKEGEEFEVLATLCVDNPQHLVIYDPVRKTKSPRNITNKAQVIAEMRREYGQRRLFTYKGRDIMLVISDQVEEVNEDVPMRAPDSLVRHLRDTLNQRFMKATTDEYR